jgi:type II secretory pathway pseudopilin PulG
MALAKFRFSKRPARNDSGFSLVEVMIATGLLAGALVALAQLFAVATQSNKIAKSGTFTEIFAEQKMEQLRGLAWGFDPLGLPVSDTNTDTATSPEKLTGGKGLSPSPSNTLQTNTDGYVDYLDNQGNVLGDGGTIIPPGTAFIRRWYIEPLPTNPNNTLILQVLVTRSRDRGTADLGSVRRLPEESRLITVKTRKAQ